MKTPIRELLLMTILISALELTGCATAGKDTLPEGGNMTMAQIYQHETGLSMDSEQDAGEASSLPQNPLLSSVPLDYVHYTLPPSNSVDALFKPLPNPEIDMYIYPHLVTENGEAEPVPGYTTAFFLYRQPYFARPNEKY